MAKFQITGPNGQKFEVTAPDDATEEQVLAYVQQNSSKQSAMGGAPKETQPGLKQQGAQLPTAFRGAVNAMQGPLLNFMDEYAGAVAAGADKLLPSALGGQRNSGMSFTQLRERYRDVARGASDSYQKENPIVALLTQVATSLPLSGLYKGAEGALWAAKGAGGLMRNAAVVGGVSGAIGGAGSAETVGDIPAEAAAGAAFGAGTSGAVAGLGQVGRNTYRNIAGRKKGSKTAADLAKERVAAALARDDATTGSVGARLTQLGEPATIADSAGKNTSDLLDTMATMPGRTRNVVENTIRTRQAGEFNRFDAAARTATETGGARLNTTVEALVQDRKTASAPLYQRLHSLGINPDADLQTLIGAAEQVGGVKMGQRIATADRVPFTLKVNDVSASGLSMRDLDYTKQGLDSIIAKTYDAQRGAYTPEGAALIRLRDALVEKLDNLTIDPRDGKSIYKIARDAYAGPSALIDAANLGKRAFAMDAVGIEGATKQFTASEMDAFRVGAYESLRNKMGSQGGRTELINLYKNNNVKERLELLFPDIKNFKQFEEFLGTAETLRKFEATGRGSQTASRNSRIDDESAAFLTDAMGAGAALKTGSLPGILQGVRNMYGRTVMPEAVRNDIGGMLLRQGPEAQALLGDLSRFVDKETQRRAAAAARDGLLGNSIASNLSSLLGN